MILLQLIPDTISRRIIYFYHVIAVDRYMPWRINFNYRNSANKIDGPLMLFRLLPFDNGARQAF